MNEFSSARTAPDTSAAAGGTNFTANVNMNINTDELDRWLDRLVDGELEAAQQRLLLQRLDDIPGSWRRCALAFLEARAWQTALPALTASLPDESEMATTPSPGKNARIVQNHRMLTWLAMAASFLLAFTIGLALREAGNSSVNPSSTGSLPGSSPLPNSTLAGNKPPVWSTMRVRLGSQDGGPQDLELPLVEGPDAEQWVRNSPTGLPPEIVAHLERSGYHVQTQRRLVPVDLDDGRRAIVPVDEVQVVNASLTQP